MTTTDLIQGFEDFSGKHKRQQREWLMTHWKQIKRALKAGQRCADELNMPYRFRSEEHTALEFNQAVGGIKPQ